MTTYLDEMKSALAAMSEARDAQDGDAFHAAFDQLQAAEQERDAVRREAIDRGLASVRATEPFGVLEREALARFVQILVEVMEERTRGELPDLNTEDGRVAFAEEITGYLGEGPLWAKLCAGYYLEQDVVDGDAIPDGVVGRALNRAIDEILPYATAGPGGWYNQEVAPKLAEL